jgi:hypothetical protein
MPCDNAMNNSFHRKIYICTSCFALLQIQCTYHATFVNPLLLSDDGCINFSRRGRIRFGLTKNIEIRSGIEIVRHSFFPDGICPPIECVCVHHRSLNKKHIKLPSIITTVTADDHVRYAVHAPKSPRSYLFFQIKLHGEHIHFFILFQNPHKAQARCAPN